MACLKFKYSDESKIYQPLIDAINKLCKDKGKDVLCTSGYRSLEKQKIINAQKLAESKGNYQITNPKDPMYGAVRNKNGVCIAGAYGKSNHCFCLACDISDTWFKALSNTELAKYDLIKPILPDEPWHVQLKSLMNINQTQKEQIRDNILNSKTGDDNVTITEFQRITGLTPDGNIGTMTKNKAKEMLVICQEILGQNYKSATETINACTGTPSIWLSLMSKTKYFENFIMSIVDKLVGRK